MQGAMFQNCSSKVNNFFSPIHPWYSGKFEQQFQPHVGTGWSSTTMHISIDTDVRSYDDNEIIYQINSTRTKITTLRTGNMNVMPTSLPN